MQEGQPFTSRLRDVQRANASLDDLRVVFRLERGNTEYVLPYVRWSSFRDTARAIAKCMKTNRVLDRYAVETYEGELVAQNESVD